MVDTPLYRKKFGLESDLVGKGELTQIDPINQPALERFIETLKLKGYSPNTLKTYKN